MINSYNKTFGTFKANLTLNPKSRSPVFEIVRGLYVINTCFKFEVKIQDDSKAIAFTRNHTDDNNDDDEETKNNMSPTS